MTCTPLRLAALLAAVALSAVLVPVPPALAGGDGDEFGDADARPVEEVLAEARTLHEEGSRLCRECMKLRGREQGDMAREGLAALKKARDLFEDVAERGSGSEEREAEDALQDINGTIFWTKRMVADLVRDAGGDADDEDKAKRGWQEAVQFEKDNRDDPAEVLLVYKAVAETWPGTEWGARARERVLYLTGLIDGLEGREDDGPEQPDDPEAPDDPDDDPDSPDDDPDSRDDDDLEPPAIDPGELARMREDMGPRSLATALGRRLENDDPRVRAAAARELGELHDRYAVRRMVKALEDEEVPDVRDAMLAALLQTHVRTTVRELGHLAKNKGDDELQVAAIGLLREIGTWRASGEIAEFMVKDYRDEAVKDAGFAALDAMGDNGSWGLVKCLELRAKEDRERVMDIMAAHGDARVAPYLMPFLDREYIKRNHGGLNGGINSKPVRTMIALGIHAMPALIDGLGDADVRQYSHYCLKEISGVRFGMDDVRQWAEWYRDNAGR